MLSVTCIFLGQQKDEYFRRAMDEYKKRMSGMCKYSEVVLRPDALCDNPSKTQIDASLEKEAKPILSLMPKNALKIALCVEGKQMSSEQLAQTFDDAASRGLSDIVFVVGSSFGLSPNVKNACDVRLSFSKMTFPHGLFAVMLLEQIYRALSINQGGKYHK